jgi:hypothetical protein
VEVKIGVVYSAKELSIELDGGKADEIVSTVEDALKGGAPVIWLTDKKGRRVGVPTDKVAYIEVAEEDTAHRVGFGPS